MSVSTRFQADVTSVMVMACPGIFHDRTEAQPDAVADGGTDGAGLSTAALDLEVVHPLGRRLKFHPVRHGERPVRWALNVARRLRQTDADSPAISA